MYSWMKCSALAVGIAAGGVMLAPSAGAEVNPPGNPNNDAYSHAAEWVAGAGGGSGGSGGAARCTLPYEESRDRPAHLEWNSYGTPGGTYSVFLNCVADGENVPTGGEGGDFPPGPLWNVVWYRTGVVPRDPQELAAEALARLRPPEAGIHTDPGDDGRPTMVGIETWLWLDADVYGPQTVTESDGPIVGGQPLLYVVVNAWPADDATVTWNMGDGTKECDDGGLPAGSCTYEYQRSSAGQANTDAGNPAYKVTATYSYMGNYQVYVMGELIDSGDLGEIERYSETFLAVEEAQAINTGG